MIGEQPPRTPTSTRPLDGRSGADDERHCPNGPRLKRRSVLAGAGAGAAALALAACRKDAGKQTAAPKVTVSEFPDARGDWTVWAVDYELGTDDETPELYQTATQQARHEALRAKKAERAWSPNEPLLVLDPYGTTRTGLYVYLESGTSGSLTFTASAPTTADFTRTAANHAETTGFEGLVIGLVPGAHSTLTLTWTPDEGGPVSGQIRIKAPTPASQYATALAADIAAPEALTPGLFAMSGITSLSNNTYLMDNTGTMRAEVAGTDVEEHHFVVEGDRIVTTTGSRQVSVLDALGHAGTIIDLGDQIAHHDLWVVDDMAYVLTSKDGSSRSEDRVTRVDLSAGEAEEILDLKDVFPEYEKLAHARSDGGLGDPAATGKDWIHLNTIQVLDGIMYLSSRETSTIIALDGALDRDARPTVRWMLGAEALWKGTGYDDHFLRAEGTPIGNAGQHSVHRVDDPALPDGQFYLEMFNNNYWYLGTRLAQDWEDAGPANASTDEMEGTSHLLRYLVDENAGTYREDLVVDVPYSSVVSNVFRLGTGRIDQNAVVNSGKAKEFSERAADGTVLGSFRYDASNLGYRVYKDTFEGFWFAGT